MSLPWVPQPPFLLATRSGSLGRSIDLACLKLRSRGLDGANHQARQHASPRTARPRARVVPVRAEAALSELAPTAAAVYGGLLLGGGLFAYTRTSSKGSLFGGLTGGTLMGLVFYLMMYPGMKDLGEAIGFGTTLLFVAIFGIRLAATRKIVPAALLLLLSIAATAIFFGAYLQDRV